MGEYNKVNVKLSDSRLNKLNSAVKNQARVTLKMKEITYLMNYYQQQDKKTKLRNVFLNNMSIDIKLSKLI